MEIGLVNTQLFLVARTQDIPQCINDGCLSSVVLADQRRQTGFQRKPESSFTNTERTEVFDANLGYVHRTPLKALVIGRKATGWAIQVHAFPPGAEYGSRAPPAYR